MARALDHPPGDAPARPSLRARLRPEIVVAVLVLLVVGPLVQDLTAQPAPRVAMTGAIVDDGTLRIDDYLLGVDRAVYDGHLYSDKAPGQAVLAVPAYAAARAVGAEPAIVPRVEGNLTHWWLAFVSGVLPLVACVFLAGHVIRRRGLDPSVGVLGTLVFGTLLLPFASNLYGHVLTGTLAFGAWVVLEGDGRPRGRAWLAGALLGLAVTCEFQTAIVAVVVIGYLLLRRRWGQVVRLVAALVPFGLALMAYQAATTGSPFRSGYESKGAPGQGMTDTHLQGPSVGQLVEVLVGSRGILLFTPVVGLAVVGLVRRWRRDRDDGAAVALAVAAGFLLLQASWANPWGGEMPGPRYLTPALPFLALGLAEMWGRVSVVVRRGLAAVSIASMGLATVVEHLVPAGGTTLGHHLRFLRSDGPVPTLFTMAVGPAGWLVHLAVVGLGLVLVHRWTAGPDRSSPPADTPSAAAEVAAGASLR